VFTVLRLLHAISWPWWLVLLPVLALAALVVALVAVAAGIYAWRNVW
jgi:hypothetical protein